MKRYLFALVALLLTLTVGHGQTNVFHPFPDSNAIWRVYESGSYASSPPVSECYDYEYSYIGVSLLPTFGE
jgi:hypothetical protein